MIGVPDERYPLEVIQGLDIILSEVAAEVPDEVAENPSVPSQPSDSAALPGQPLDIAEAPAQRLQGERFVTARTKVRELLVLFLHTLRCLPKYQQQPDHQCNYTHCATRVAQ